MRALIDSDSITYAAGFASQTKVYTAVDEEGNVFGDSEDKLELQERYPDLLLDHYVVPDSEYIARYNTDVMVERILERLDNYVKVTDYQLYLTGGDNFRKEVATIQPYKGNRVAPRPEHFDTTRAHLVEKWGAIVIEGMEADDQLAIEAERDRDGVILVSIDKDLNTVPGWHFSWGTHNKEEDYYFVTEQEATRFFWTQVLTGDKGDNIPGLSRVGPKKAAKILEGCTTQREYYEACLEAYKKQYEEPEKALAENATLLYLLRSEDDQWRVPE